MQTYLLLNFAQFCSVFSVIECNPQDREQELPEHFVHYLNALRVILRFGRIKLCFLRLGTRLVLQDSPECFVIIKGRLEFLTSPVVACPLAVNGVDLVFNHFCLDGPEPWWRGWHDVLADWCSARIAEKYAN